MNIIARGMQALLLAFVLVSSLAVARQEASGTPAVKAPPGCSNGDCGLRTSSAHAGLVVGIFQRVETDDEMRTLYRWGKDSGVWKDFDDDLDDFLARNRVLHITVGAARTPFILIISRAEYEGAPPVSGDLVRYVPLRSHHDGEGRKAPSRFSVLSGCVAILCRKADLPCPGNYAEGFYNKDSGVEIDVHTGQGIPDGKEVDPVTVLSRKPDVRAR